jgi:histidinol dehydrogenase
MIRVLAVPPFEALDPMLPRRAGNDAATRETVRAILDDVLARGDDAVREYGRRFDGVDLPPGEWPLDAGTWQGALGRVSPPIRAALERAVDRVRSYHEHQREPGFHLTDADGSLVGMKVTPLDRVGLYIPGGKASYPSSVIMNAVPALVAGVQEIVAVVPPQGVTDVVLAACALSGVTRIFRVGGAQAIAALAFGAGAIPRVAKICGPGNAWVAEAKTVVSALPGGPAIDMPAGPSELLVIADDSADPALVTADLLSQAEHDPSAQVILATPSAALADAVAGRIETDAAALPRADIALASLANARLILTDSLDQAVAVANAYAPEHLSLAVDDPDPLVPGITNAGAIFAGHCAAETFGDYLAGSSHVLPTDGAARAWSGVSVFTFLKAISVQTLTDEAASRLAGPAAVLARMEGLEAHARAADARLAGASA